MGVNGLLLFLSELSRSCHLKEFSGSTVAIDGYGWLHKGAFACADKLVRGEETDIYVRHCMKYINMFISYNIKPILVFDGQRLPAKNETDMKRREQRQFNKTRGMELLRLGKLDEANTYFRQCVSINHTMVLNLIRACRERNIDCIVAPYEADAQLTYLNFVGIADIIITEDSDLIMYGCHKIIYKLNLTGTGMLIEKSKLNMVMRMGDHFTFDKFRHMCIMSGCDYLESLPGIGLKRAYKAITSAWNPDIYKLLKRLPHYIRVKNLKVTEEYIEQFKLADATIRHQIVFDPIERRLLPLTDPESIGTSAEYLVNAGAICDRDSALQMALGNVDPCTKERVDNWNPDQVQDSLTSQSIWSKNYKKAEWPRQTTSTQNVKGKKAVEFPVEAMGQQMQIEYDVKLSQELKVYQNSEPPLKRLRRNSNEQVPEPKSVVTTSPSLNPFVVPKRLSKFAMTNDATEKGFNSRFFHPTRSEDLDGATQSSSFLSKNQTLTNQNGRDDLQLKSLKGNETDNPSKSVEKELLLKHIGEFSPNNKNSSIISKPTSPILSEFSARQRYGPKLGTFKFNKLTKRYTSAMQSSSKNGNFDDSGTEPDENTAYNSQNSGTSEIKASKLEELLEDSNDTREVAIEVAALVINNSVTNVSQRSETKDIYKIESLTQYMTKNVDNRLIIKNSNSAKLICDNNYGINDETDITQGGLKDTGSCPHVVHGCGDEKVEDDVIVCEQYTYASTSKVASVNQIKSNYYSSRGKSAKNKKNKSQNKTSGVQLKIDSMFKKLNP